MVEHVEDMDLKDVESTFQSNIIAMIAMAKYAVPHMKRGSTIVNSTSVTAFKGTSTSGRPTLSVCSQTLQGAPPCSITRQQKVLLQHSPVH